MQKRLLSHGQRYGQQKSQAQKPSAAGCKATHGHHGPILSLDLLSAFLDTWLVELHAGWQSIVAEKDGESICELTGKA